MKTRLLIISNSGHVVGGGEISLRQFLRRVDATQFDVDVLCPDPGPLWRQLNTDALEGGGFRVLRPFEMPGLKGRGLLEFPQRLCGLAKLMQRGGYDLVYANGSRCMIYAGPAARWRRIPITWHVRVPTGERLDRLLGASANRIVVNSRATARRFTRFRDKVSVVHNGVDHDRFAPGLSGRAFREECAIPDDARVLLQMGRLERDKGQAHFLEAFAGLSEADPATWAVLAGRGPDEASLRRLAVRLGVERRVVWAGHRDDAASVIAAADVLVSASRTEGFGRTLVEAMSMATPCVAFDTGGVPEVVVDGETGCLVPLDDVPAMTAALGRLLGDVELRRRMGIAGRRRVEAHFGADAHARRLESVLGRVAASSGTSAAQAAWGWSGPENVNR